ncbi:MAG: NADH dehydrogenase [Syntrophaceae bacterium PtaU1.Bin231]|nr:MAG: NADH dehydrogenase [Syntrophaceae bacterium PtaU1.Bin231]
MDIVDAIKTRRSIRGYKPDPVPRAIIEEILEIAVRAPSAMNTQPWEFTILAGEPLRKIMEENVKKVRARIEPYAEIDVIGWTNDSIYRTRQVDLAKYIFQVMDIQREDKVKRGAWMERGFRYFDAPAAIIISVDKSLSVVGPVLDCGALMQNICLTAMHYGLGTCIHDQGVMYPDVVREYAGIPETKRLIIAISIGWPKEGEIVNTITTTREPAAGVTTWVGFS